MLANVLIGETQRVVLNTRQLPPRHPLQSAYSHIPCLHLNLHRQLQIQFTCVDLNTNQIKCSVLSVGKIGNIVLRVGIKPIYSGLMCHHYTIIIFLPLEL